MDALTRFAVAAALLIAVPANADPLARWQPIVAQTSLRFGIPERWILRVIRAESGGQTMRNGKTIVSRAGAMGLMQLMPKTWSAMRVSLRLGIDPHDPHDNIVAGTAYLRLMYDRFGYPGLFAAYNAGPGRYADHLTSGRALPRETRAYLATVAGRGPDAAPRTPMRPALPANPLFAVRRIVANDTTSPAPAARQNRFHRDDARHDDNSASLFVTFTPR